MPCVANGNACLQLHGSGCCNARAKHKTSKQHKEMSNARQVRDFKDKLELFGYLKEQNPFSSDPNLRSVSQGVVAEASLNVDRSKRVGNEVLKSMIGQGVQD